tara:strand:+ start:560 stop:1366 length:807 start_codon:yes stop_codon:yes gene_type:complete
MGIQQLKSSKILLIGDSCIDKYHFGDCRRLSPEAPVPIFKLIKTTTTPGMAGNVKVNLENLGNSVDLVSNNNKITKERFVDVGSKQHIMRLDTGEQEKSQKFSQINKIDYEKYDCIVISDYNKGFLDYKTINNLTSLCKEKNIPVFVDSKKRDLSCYNNCIIKINENENNNLIKRSESSQYIITLGKMGAQHNGRVYKSFPSEVDETNLPPNVCGAGDTFLSGLVSYYMTNENLSESIMFANFCASVAVKNFGTYAIKLNDTKAFKKS